MSERRFNGRQRVALYLAQSGVCARCGANLEPGWHADHRTPWSHGGPTDVVNGQALCPTCNLQKGASVETIELREWQKLAKRQYHADGKPDWLACVTPGGGKTKWALSIASDLLHAQTVERIVVVVPTDTLRTQWTKQRIVDLAIVNNADGGHEPRPFQGCVVTYAQVASAPDLHRHWCSRIKTAVIFDEIHHAGDAQTWGKAIESAFEPAVRRIAMTGTPWRAPRSGNIPFVSYDLVGRVESNFKFTYGDAVRSRPQVCRVVQFYPFDGSVTYINLTVDSCVPQPQVVQLGEAEDDDSPVLRDILKVDGKWMPSILQKAVQTLDEIRLAIPDAKMLIVVHDRSEARAVAKLEREIFHERPALIISDPEEGEPSPQEELEKFRKDQRKFAIAVDMVSEGVDIPPLYVCVYATRKKTPLRFQQIVGRVIRKRPDDDLPAVVFIPAVPSLLKLAGEVDEMIIHEMDKEIDGINKERKQEHIQQPIEDPVDPFFVLDTSEATRTGAISGGAAFHEHELREAEKWCEECGIPMIYAPSIAKKLRSQGMLGEAKSDTNSAQEQNSPVEISLQEEYTRLRSLLDKEVGSVAGIMTHQRNVDIGSAKKEVNARVQTWFNKQRKHMSVDELKDALVRMRQWHDTIRNEIQP